MYSKKIIILLILILLPNLAIANTSKFIGVVGAAIGEIKNQNDESLVDGSKIFFGDTIISKEKSNAQILFLDQTVLTLGEDTELTIDEFIYDPKSHEGSFISNVKSGTVKFITGQISKQNPENLEVKVPSGVLGARGTEFIVLSENENKSTVVLLGPGPENTLGMIPGNLILSDGINSINITNPGYEAMVTN
tara:strand:+ start:1210 stop:1785 length:576 start_codon:yes stop_codon:yes gene_type:complete